MTLRPRIEEETVERVNEELEDAMAIDPEKVGLDEKINVALDELASERFKRQRAENRAEQDTHGMR